MKISRLSVQNVRSHSVSKVEFSPQTTLISGQNGSGKTTLLEAVYLALRGTSFKGSDRTILRSGSEWWRIDLVFDNDQTRTITFDSTKGARQKQFKVDSLTHYRLPARQKIPTVLFEPNDLRLLHGSPARRRQFIDQMIEQVEPGYKTVVGKYERALKQRNSLLKNGTFSNDELFVWNIALSDYGSEIIKRRSGFANRLNMRLGALYTDISKTDDQIDIHYSFQANDGIKQKLLNELTSGLEKDKILGFTRVGPHRHDVIFSFNSSPALEVASRGEVRSIVLALKFLEAEIIRELSGVSPIVLLDDVFSELDETRQQQVVDNFRDYQEIITSVNHIDGLDARQIEI